MCACQQMSSMDGATANVNAAVGLNGQVSTTAAETAPTATTNSQPVKTPVMGKVSDWIATASELFKTAQSSAAAPVKSSKVPDSVWIAGGILVVLVAGYFLFGRKA